MRLSRSRWLRFLAQQRLFRLMRSSRIPKSIAEIDETDAMIVTVEIGDAVKMDAIGAISYPVEFSGIIEIVETNCIDEVGEVVEIGLLRVVSVVVEKDETCEIVETFGIAEDAEIVGVTEIGDHRYRWDRPSCTCLVYGCVCGMCVL